MKKIKKLRGLSFNRLVVKPSNMVVIGLSSKKELDCLTDKLNEIIDVLNSTKETKKGGDL